MTITPEQAKERFNRHIKAELGKLEKKIDNVLMRDFPNYGGMVAIIGIVDIDYRIIQEVKKMYENLGWVVKYVSDQREGDFLEFKLKNEYKNEK